MHAIGEAAEIIRRGDADAMLAGGVESCIHPLIFAGFTAMRGLGTPRDGEGPETASRPFDATRNGFVCSEGASVVMVESLDARWPAAPASTPRCWATGSRTTPTTWRRRAPTRSG